MCVTILINIHNNTLYFQHKLLTLYDGSVTTLLTIAEAKQRRSLVRIHFVYFLRNKTISLKRMPILVKELIGLMSKRKILFSKSNMSLVRQ
jgi:hypothetical protein